MTHPASAAASGAAFGTAFGTPSADDRPVYIISVAAELAGMHPQTLRAYDRAGLVSPGRAGRARRYSARDIALLREVARLSQDEGVGRAGVRHILALQREVAALQAEVARLVTSLAAAQRDVEGAVTAARAAQRRDLVPIRSRPGTDVVLWRRRRLLDEK